MLHISRAQIDVLDRAAAADLHARLAEFMRTELPDETAGFSDAQLLDLIREAHARAAAHGIESDAGVAQYACLSLEAGPGFADQPSIAEFLNEQGMDPEEQLEYLVDLLADKDELAGLAAIAAEAGDGELLAELQAELDAFESDEA